MKNQQKPCPRCRRMIRMVHVHESPSWFATHDDQLLKRPCPASSRTLEELAAEDTATPIADQINAAQFDVAFAKA